MWLWYKDMWLICYLAYKKHMSFLCCFCVKWGYQQKIVAEHSVLHRVSPLTQNIVIIKSLTFQILYIFKWVGVKIQMRDNRSGAPQYAYNVCSGAQCAPYFEEQSITKSNLLQNKNINLSKEWAKRGYQKNRSGAQCAP